MVLTITYRKKSKSIFHKMKILLNINLNAFKMENEKKNPQQQVFFTEYEKKTRKK